MAKEILKVAREHTVNWGQRVVTEDDTARLAAILSAQSKRDSAEFVSLSFTRNSLTEGTADAVISEAQYEAMIGQGITHCAITASVFNLATGQWVPLAQVMSTGYLALNDSASVLTFDSALPEGGDSFSESLQISEFIPEANHAAHQIVVFVIMPARKVGNLINILQEYCSFVAMPLPAVTQP